MARFTKKALAALVASLSLSSPVWAQDSFDRLWVEHGAALEAEGITQPMARAAIHWTELQVHLGRCRSGLEPDTVRFWREWWKNTPLQQSRMGMAIIEAGNQLYISGLEKAVSDPLSTGNCQRVLDSWVTELRSILPEAL